MEILVIIVSIIFVTPVIIGIFYIIHDGIVLSKAEFEHSGYYQILSDHHKNQLGESFEKLKNRNWTLFWITSGVASVYILSVVYYISTIDTLEKYQKVSPILFSGMVFLAAIYVLIIFAINGNGFEITLWSLFFTEIGINTEGLVEKSLLKWEFWRPRNFSVLRNSFINKYYPEVSFSERYRLIKEVVREDTPIMKRFDTIAVTRNFVNDLRILGVWPYDTKGRPFSILGLAIMVLTLVFLLFRFNKLSEFSIVLSLLLLLTGIISTLAGRYISNTLTREKIRYILDRRNILTVNKSTDQLFDDLCQILDREYPVIDLE